MCFRWLCGCHEECEHAGQPGHEVIEFEWKCEKCAYPGEYDDFDFEAANRRYEEDRKLKKDRCANCGKITK